MCVRKLRLKRYCWETKSQLGVEFAISGRSDKLANAQWWRIFVMIYQENVTKFAQLRALNTKRAEEVAYHLLQIFLIFDAQLYCIQTMVGNSITESSELCAMWKDIKIVLGEPRAFCTICQKYNLPRMKPPESLILSIIWRKTKNRHTILQIQNTDIDYKLQILKLKNSFLN